MKFKIQTFSESYPDMFVVYYRRHNFSFWNILNCLIDFGLASTEPSKEHPKFFNSIKEAEDFVFNNFKDDESLRTYLNNLNKSYDEAYDVYKKKRVLKVKHL